MLTALYPQAVKVSATTDASGNATVYSPRIAGRIWAIKYTKTDFATGVDFTITTEDTGQTVWDEDNVDASKTVAPRQATHATDGTASLYAAGGEPVEDYILACDERIKIVIANGGDTKTGTLTIIYA